MAIRGRDEALVRHEHGKSLAQAQEHRGLHVMDVVIGAVDRGRTRDGAREARARMTIEDHALGMGLEAAVGGLGVIAVRLVFRPGHESRGRVRHDRRDEDIRAHAAVEQVDEILEEPAAGGHDEARHVDDGIPLGALEGRAHRLGAGAIADDAAHALGKLTGGLAAVEDGDLVARPPQLLDRATSDEGASTEDECLHAVTLAEIPDL